MISISAPVFDINGTLAMVATGSRIKDISRRVSRTATLDGRSDFTDLGYSDSDRSLQIVQKRPTRAESSAAAYLLKNYPLLTVANIDGVYSAAPESISDDGQTLTINMLVKEKLSE